MIARQDDERRPMAAGGAGIHDPEERDRRAEEMWRLWRYRGMKQSEIAEMFGVSRVWVNSEINRFIKSTDRGQKARRRYERIQMSRSEKAATKNQLRRAKTIDRYRMMMRDVINGMNVQQVGLKYGRSYQTIMKGFAIVREADPDLYEQYVRANRTHRFGWNRRKRNENIN